MKPIASPPPDFALERFLPYRLSVLTNTISRAFARRYAERFGLTIAEWRVMAVLGRFAPLSAGDVADRTAMDKVQVSRAVARLRRRRLLARAIDGADRRRSALSLSAAGQAIHRAIVPEARAIESALTEELSARERYALDGLLARLDARARALGPGG
jgi:DNA-binding MarR family transcriptional regulator